MLFVGIHKLKFIGTHKNPSAIPIVSIHTTWGMSADTDDGVGVKMLADHLVQVKEQYEGGYWCWIDHVLERINALTNQMQELELEKTQMERAFKKMEKELDQKRVEILNMKRANVAQHAIEERENWKAVVMQQKSENKRLQSGILLFDGIYI